MVSCAVCKKYAFINGKCFALVRYLLGKKYELYKSTFFGNLHLNHIIPVEKHQSRLQAVSIDMIHTKCIYIEGDICDFAVHCLHQNEYVK